MKFEEGRHPGGLRLTDRAARLAGMSPGISVLDVGCGMGQSLVFLESTYGVIAHGIDISEKHITIARHRLPSAVFSVGYAEAIPYKDASFDIVICECVLSLVNESAQAISEMFRVLKPLGVLIISDVCSEEELDAVREMFCKENFEVTLFEEHKAALITYAAEAYQSGAMSSCFTATVETVRSIYGKSTYYLAICQRGEDF